MRLERTREREALIAGGGPKSQTRLQKAEWAGGKGAPGWPAGPAWRSRRGTRRGDTSLASAAHSSSCAGAQRTQRVGGEEGPRATRALSRGVIPSSWDRTHDKDN